MSNWFDHFTSKRVKRRKGESFKVKDDLPFPLVTVLLPMTYNEQITSEKQMPSQTE